MKTIADPTADVDRKLNAIEQRIGLIKESAEVELKAALYQLEGVREESRRQRSQEMFGDLPDILEVKDVAEYLKISVNRVYELLILSPSAGGLPHIRLGGIKRVIKDDLVTWILSQRITDNVSTIPQRKRGAK
jgi:excisionase family DNA binding protein